MFTTYKPYLFSQQGIVHLLCGTCPPSEHHQPNAELTDGLQIAKHVIGHHSLHNPMIPTYVCAFCRQKFDRRKYLNDHLERNHNLAPTIMLFTDLVHLCMFPGCSRSHDHFLSEDHLSAHVKEHHAIHRDYFYLYMTTIRHHDLIWHPHHEIPSHQLDNRRSHLVQHVYHDIQREHIRILGFLHTAIINLQNCNKTREDPAAIIHVPADSDELVFKAQEIRRKIIDALHGINLQRVVSRIFATMLYATRSEWSKDMANYSWMCTVLTCTHNNMLFETLHDWDNHMCLFHKPLAEHLQKEFKTVDMDLFVIPVSRMVSQISPGWIEKDDGICKAILCQAESHMQVKRKEYDTSLADPALQLSIHNSMEQVKEIGKRNIRITKSKYRNILDLERMRYLALRSIDLRRIDPRRLAWNPVDLLSTYHTPSID